MSDDIARLGFQIDSGALVQAAKLAAGTAAELDKVGASADKMAAKTKAAAPELEKVGTAADKASTKSKAAADGLDKVGTAADKMAAKTKAAGAGVGDAADKLKKMEDVAVKAQGGITSLTRNIGALAQQFGSATGLNLGGGALTGALNATGKGMDAVVGVAARFGPIAGAAAAGVGALATGYIALNVALAGAQDKWVLTEARIKLATGSTLIAADAFKTLEAQSRTTGISLDTTTQSFIRIARLKDQIGVTTEQVLQLTDTVQKLGIVSGSSGGEIQGAMVQFSQALASGKLNGDELRSIMESMPALAKAIADGLGVSVGAIRSMGAAGELTGDKIFKALLSQTEKVNADFARMPRTTEQAFTNMKDQASLLMGDLGRIMDSSGLAQNFVSGFSGAMSGVRSLLKEKSLAERRLELESYEKLGMFMPQSARDELAGIKHAQYLDSRTRDRVGLGELEAAEDAKVGKANTVAKEIDNLGKNQTENKTRMDTLASGIARVREQLKAKPGDEGLTKTLTGLNTAMAIARQSAADDVDAFSKFSKTLSDLNKQIAIGGGGGGIAIVAKAQSVMEAGARQGRGVGMGTALGAATSEAVARTGMQISDIERQAAATRRMNAVIGESAVVVREAEIAQAALDFRWKEFGTLTGPGITKAVERYTVALRSMKVAQEAAAVAQAKLAISDNIGGIKAADNARPSGAFAVRQAEAMHAATIAARSMNDPSLQAGRMDEFWTRENSQARGSIADMARQTDRTRAMAGVAGDPVAQRKLALDHRVEDARRNVDGPNRDDIESAIRDGDAAERAKAMADQTAQMREQLAYSKEQVGLTKLTGRDQAVQMALLERKRMLLREGVDLTSAEAAEQLVLTENIAKQNYQLQLAQEQAAEYKRVWTVAAEGIQNALSSAFDVMLSKTEGKGKQVLSIIGDYARKVAAQIMAASVFTPISQWATGGGGSSLLGSIASAIGGAFGFGGGSSGGGGGGGSYGLPSTPISQATAAGGAFNNGNVIPFAKGGVVRRPTYFGMSGGRTGLMGEAGEEGILPLRRDSQGRLGVMGGGGGGGGVVININDMRSSRDAAPVEAKESTGPDGQRMIQIMVRDEVRRAVRSGELDKEMGDAYGTRRALTKR